MFGDIVFIKVFCKIHMTQTWHILRIDGILDCLECRLTAESGAIVILEAKTHECPACQDSLERFGVLPFYCRECGAENINPHSPGTHGATLQ